MMTGVVFNKVTACQWLHQIASLISSTFYMERPCVMRLWIAPIDWKARLAIVSLYPKMSKRQIRR